MGSVPPRFWGTESRSRLRPMGEAGCRKDRQTSLGLLLGSFNWRLPELSEVVPFFEFVIGLGTTWACPGRVVSVRLFVFVLGGPG